MDPVQPRAEARSMPRVPADALPPTERRVPPPGSHHRRHLGLGLAGLTLLTLLLLALVVRGREHREPRDTAIVGGEVVGPRAP